MLLIPCPYCGGARRLEFAYGGEAHIARPADPVRADRRGVGGLPLHPHQPARACTSSAGGTSHGCGRFFNAVRDTVTDKFVATYKAGEPRPDRSQAAAGAGGTPMSQPSASPAGGRIDRAQAAPLHLRRQRTITGFAGDTLASALLANGVHLVGRSFKYHRPRGILSAGAEEPNALVGVDRGAGRIDAEPARHQVELYDGLVARRARTAGRRSRFDVGAVNDLALAAVLGRLLLQDLHVAAGVLEARSTSRSSARAAGLGVAPDASPIPTATRSRYAHCDVLVVGAGPAGLAAALAAARSGARVILCDEQAELGGSLLAEPGADDRRASRAWDWLADALAALAAHAERHAAAAHHGVRLLRTRTSSGSAERLTDHLAAVPADGCRASGCGRCAPSRSCSRQGAIERPLVFAGNDRPGVMLAGAGAHLSQPLRRHGRQRAPSSSPRTTAPSAPRFDLAQAGVDVAAIVDLAASVPDALAGRGRGAAASRSLRGRTVTGTRRPAARSRSVRVNPVEPTARSAPAQRSPATRS